MVRHTRVHKLVALGTTCLLLAGASSVSAATKTTKKKVTTTKAVATTAPSTAAPSAAAPAATAAPAAAAVDVSKFADKPLRIMAPAAPGGGWDQTSRSLQRVMQDGKIRDRVEVFNVPGAGGTIGLAQMVANESGKSDLLMTMGLVMVGSIETNRPPATLDSRFVVPIARLTAEDEIIVVPANSKYKTLKDLLADLAVDPGSVSIAGGSAGGTDHILAGLLAKKAGVDGKRVNYVPFSGGGAALAALLGGKVSAGISGVGEFAPQVKEGKLRALATSGDKRVPGLNVPTITEAGVDLVLTNWRGLVAPKGMSAAAVKELQDTVAALYQSKGWKEELAKQGWDDAYLPGAAYRKFLDAEELRIRSVLRDIGLI